MNRRNLLTASVALPALYLSRKLSQKTDAQLSDRVADVVQSEAIRQGVCGVAVSVTRDATVLMEAGFGHSDLQRSAHVNPDTRFNIASLSKPFTAAAVMKLVESGRVRLDTAVSSYLPWIPPRYEPITVRQLLTHTSGVNRDLRNENLDDFNEAEFRRRLADRPASFAPGAKWQYSNTGYGLLTFLIEAVSKRPFGEYLQSEILAPAGVTAAYRLPAPHEPDRAVGYSAAPDGPQPSPYYTGGFGGGALVMSVRALTRWCQALAAHRVLTAPSLRQAWQPARLANGRPVEFDFAGEPASSYGFGWFLTHFSGHRLLTHGGAIEGFSSNLYFFPDAPLIVGILSNTKGRLDGKPHVEILAQRLASLLL
ncbi:MAG: serine hydrolase domain-containing protein [Candidatus Acidiferrales bacterium]